MTRYLLDTKVISDAVKPRPSASLIEWLGDRDDSSLFIASLSVAEIARGVFKQPQGRWRALEAWFAGPEGPQALFPGRVLPFGQRGAGLGAADGREHRLRLPAQPQVC